MLENTAIVIPARMESSRFPGKPLRKMADGRTLLAATHDAAKETAKNVVVASADPEIGEECRRIRADFFDQRGVVFSTGTHRCADVIRWRHRHSLVVVNWQVDEPRVPPAWAEMLVRRLLDSEFRIATLVAPVDDRAAFAADESRVKAWTRGAECLAFSRGGVSSSAEEPLAVLEHVGIYAFLTDTLRELGRLPPSSRSVSESLEQLAWLDAGYKILAVECPGPAPRAVNSPEDL